MPYLGCYHDHTGHARFRKGWFGRLVLQVEVVIDRDDALGGSQRRWIDAEETDLRWIRKIRQRRGFEPLI